MVSLTSKQRNIGAFSKISIFQIYILVLVTFIFNAFLLTALYFSLLSLVTLFLKNSFFKICFFKDKRRYEGSMPSADREERNNSDKCLQMGLFLTLLNFSCNFSFKNVR